MTREEEIVQAANKNYPSLDSEKSYEGFKDGAKWADQHPKKGLWDAEKVIEWLNNWFTDDICKCDLPITKDARNIFFNDLRKAMED